MTEKLLHDYLEANDLNHFNPFNVDNIQVAGHLVMFRENEGAIPEFGANTEYHNIILLDIIAWLYKDGVL